MATAAAQRQRVRASERAADRRRPRLVAEEPQAGPTAYRKASLLDDPERSELLLLHRTVGLLTDAREAEAWTAIAKLHQMCIDGVRGIRAIRSARADGVEADEAAQQAALKQALGDMTSDERRDLLRIA